MNYSLIWLNLAKRINCNYSYFKRQQCEFTNCMNLTIIVSRGEHSYNKITVAYGNYSVFRRLERAITGAKVSQLWSDHSPFLWRSLSRNIYVCVRTTTIMIKLADLIHMGRPNDRFTAAWTWSHYWPTVLRY